MPVDFNEIKEVTIPGMDNGTGKMSARMYMDEQGKVIHVGGLSACTSMKQATKSTMSCRKPAKRYATDKRSCCVPVPAISAKRARNTASSTPGTAI